MSVECKDTMIKTITRKDENGDVLEVLETKYHKYNYFSLQITSSYNSKGELKKKFMFPKDWLNIKQSYNPKHNAIALICGKKSGIFVVDYDQKSSFLRDAGRYPELKNHYLETRKGYHAYFKWTSEVQEKIGSTSVKEKNIDFQGDKRCVITEPTTYKDPKGNVYKYKYLHEEPLKPMGNDLIKYYLVNYLKKTKNKIKESSLVVAGEIQDEVKEFDISPLLNEMFNVNYKWDYTETDKGGFRITNNGHTCLVKDKEEHKDLNHSCLFINKGVSIAHCFSHEKKKLLMKNYPKLKDLKIMFGLVEPKKSLSEEKNNDFEMLMYTMLEHTKEKKYKKEKGWILKPVEGVPTFYEDFMEYSDFLDELFSDKEEITYKIFRKRVSNKHQLLDYLKTYNDKELPFIKRDPYIYSFNNGFLDIKTLEFKQYNSDTDYKNVCSSVYIKQDFKPDLLNKEFMDIKTPHFDKLLKYHVKDEEAYNIILALVGRLFFNTREYDNWQCMLFIKGQANTGKSTFIEIIETLFHMRDIGVIGQTLERTFGLQNLYNKRLIVSSDIPLKISDKLDATTLQKMISGEKVPVPIKNGDAKYVDWLAQMLWAGNFFPDYSDKSGSVSRRFATVNMGKRVKEKDASLKQKIINLEIISLLVKFIKAYKFYLVKFGTVVFEDWGKKFGVKYFDKAREEFKQENDLLYAFCNAPPGANKTRNTNYWIEHKEGSFVSLELFKKRFKAFARFKHGVKNYKWSNTSDNATLEMLDYKIKRVDICASCGKKAKKGCCDNYSGKNRRRRFVIENMVIRDGFEECMDFSEPDL